MKRWLAGQASVYAARELNQLLATPGASDPEHVAELRALFVAEQLLEVNVIYGSLVTFDKWTEPPWPTVNRDMPGFLGAWYHAINYQVLCDRTSAIVLELLHAPSTAVDALTEWFEETSAGKHYLAELGQTDARRLAEWQVADAQRCLPGDLVTRALEGHVRMSALRSNLALAPEAVVGLDPTLYPGTVR